MAWGLGLDLLVGVTKASTWGTSVAVDAANKGFRPTSFTVNETVDPLPDKSYNADALDKETTDTGRERVSGSFGFDMKVEGLEIPLALFFGTAGTPAGGPTYYTHTLYHKNDMSGIFGTLAYFDGVVTHEIDSVKFTGLTLSGKVGEAIQGELRWQGRRRQEDTATNPSGLTSLTEPANIDRVIADAAIVSYQTITQGGTLANLELNTWSVTMERAYDDDDRAFTSTDAPWRSEMQSGALTVTGELMIPHEATTYMLAVASGTTYELKLHHVLTASQKEMGLWLPSVTWETWNADPQDKGGIGQKLTFRTDKADATPTSFSQAVPYVELTNQSSADPLA